MNDEMIAPPPLRPKMKNYILNSIQFTKSTTENLLIKYSAVFPTENGGVLIGQVNPTQILITDFTEPAKHDQLGKFSFIRRSKGVNKVLRRLFEEGGKTKTYLGEWHTHHENKPKPSQTDLNTLIEQFQKNTLAIPFALSLIIGYQGYLLMLYDGKYIKKKYFAFNNKKE